MITVKGKEKRRGPQQQQAPAMAGISRPGARRGQRRNRGDSFGGDMANGPSDGAAAAASRPQQGTATDGAVVEARRRPLAVRGGLSGLLPIVRHSPSRVRIFIISASAASSQWRRRRAARLARPALRRGHPLLVPSTARGGCMRLARCIRRSGGAAGSLHVCETTGTFACRLRLRYHVKHRASRDAGVSRRIALVWQLMRT